MNKIEFFKKVMAGNNILHITVDDIVEDPDDEGDFAEVYVSVVELNSSETYVLTVER